MSAPSPTSAAPSRVDLKELKRLHDLASEYGSYSPAGSAFFQFCVVHVPAILSALQPVEAVEGEVKDTLENLRSCALWLEEEQGDKLGATCVAFAATLIERLSADLARVTGERDELNKLGYDINTKWRLEQEESAAARQSLGQEIELRLTAERDLARVTEERDNWRDAYDRLQITAANMTVDADQRAITAERDLKTALAQVRALLSYEKRAAKLHGLDGCTCIKHSRPDEMLYEEGECPHQLARQALKSITI